MLTDHQANHLVDATFLQRVHVYPTLPSTNDEAKKQARAGQIEAPTLFITAEQTAGRGRGGNRWISAPGALTFSLALPAKHYAITAEAHGRFSLRTAIGVRDGILQATQVGCQLKWPNDIYWEGRKLGGILIESVAESSVWVIGIGLNVNNPAAAPSDYPVVSLCEAAHEPLDPVALLVALVDSLEASWTRVPQATLQADWQPLCYLAGRSIAIDSGGQSCVGDCLGVDEDGALLVAGKAGKRRFFSGSVRVI